MKSHTDNDGLKQIESQRQIITNLKADLERIQTSHAMLKYSSNLYRKFFKTSPDPIVVMRLSDGRLLEANQRFEKLLGYSKEEFREIGIENCLVQDIKRIKKMAREALRNGAWFETNCKLQSRSKDFIPVSISASLIKHDEQTLVQASIRPVVISN